MKKIREIYFRKMAILTYFAYFKAIYLEKMAQGNQNYADRREAGISSLRFYASN